MRMISVALGTPGNLRNGLRRRFQLKGRQPEEAAVAEARALIGSRHPGATARTC